MCSLTDSNLSRALKVDLYTCRDIRMVEMSVRRSLAGAKGLPRTCREPPKALSSTAFHFLSFSTLVTRSQLAMSESSVDYETASEPMDQLDLGDSDSPSPSPLPSRTAYVPPHRRNAEQKHVPSPVDDGPRQTERGTFQPRRRLSESELPKPSAEYLGVADQSSDTLSVPPLIVVLVFNTTLVQRRPGDGDERKDPLTRPYLSTFLSYLFHTPKDSSTQPLFRPRRPIQTIIYTGVRVHNIIAVLKALGLAPPERKLGFRQSYSVDPEQGDIFSLVLSREDMNLGDAYFENIDTVKDLRLVWKRLGVEEEDGAKRTVLVSSQAVDAASFSSLQDVSWDAVGALCSS